MSSGVDQLLNFGTQEVVAQHHLAGGDPWKGFDATGGRPKPGDIWRFAACRYDYSKDFDQPELSSIANVRTGFHSYEDYAALRFEKR